jgi:hypothetical protein
MKVHNSYLKANYTFCILNNVFASMNTCNTSPFCEFKFHSMQLGSNANCSDALYMFTVVH